MKKPPFAIDIKSVFLLGMLSILLMVLGDKVAGQSGALVALMLAILLSVFLYWFGDKMILSFLSAKAVSQEEELELYGIVAYLSEKAELVKPRIFVFLHAFPSALVVGRSAKHAALVVSTGLLQGLDKEEKAAVLAHELSHILHRDMLVGTLAASIGVLIRILGNYLQWVLLLGATDRRKKPGELSFLARVMISMVAPMIAILIQMTLSREREFKADEVAANLCGNVDVLGNALRKLERAREQHQIMEIEAIPTLAHLWTINPLHSRQWKLFFGTHPTVDERIRRLDALIL